MRQGAVALWEHWTLVSDFQSKRGFESRSVQQSFARGVALRTEYHSACLNRYYGLNITHLLESVVVSVIQAIGRQVYEKSSLRGAQWLPCGGWDWLTTQQNLSVLWTSLQRHLWHFHVITPMDLSHGTVAFTLLQYKLTASGSIASSWVWSYIRSEWDARWEIPG